MTITQNNVQQFISNNRVATKRLSKYNIDSKYDWCKTKTESIYCIINDVTKQPLCYCGKVTKYLSYSVGYQRFCSNKCSNNSKDVILKQINNKDWETASKRMSESMSNYSEEKRKEIKAKKEQTSVEKYGSKTYNNREKAKKTSVEKYGVEYAIQRDDIKEKVRKSQFEKYGGFFNPTQFKETNIEKYGVEYPLQNSGVALKFSKTLRIKYNSEKSKEGYVYTIFFTDLNLVKIGYTSNMKNRSRQLIKDFGEFEIISLNYFDDAYKEERRLHKLYDNENVVLSEGVGKTEFFHPTIL